MAKKKSTKTKSKSEKGEAKESKQQERYEASTEKGDQTHAEQERAEARVHDKSEPEDVKEVVLDAINDTSVPFSDLGHSVSQLFTMTYDERLAILGPERNKTFEKKYMSQKVS